MQRRTAMRHISFVLLVVPFAVMSCGRLDSHPYPECQQIVDYFARNANDPSSLEFTWIERRSAVANCTSRDPNDYDIYIKVRGKNAQGAKAVSKHTCVIRDGKLTQVFDFWVDQRSNSDGKAPAPPSD
jgi:hypothetical protein